MIWRLGESIGHSLGGSRRAFAEAGRLVGWPNGVRIDPRCKAHDHPVQTLVPTSTDLLHFNALECVAQSLILVRQHRLDRSRRMAAWKLPGV